MACSDLKIFISSSNVNATVLIVDDKLFNNAFSSVNCTLASILSNW